MSIAEWTAAVGLIVQVLAMAVSALWVVTHLRSTSFEVTKSLEHLSDTMKDLQGAIRVIEKQQNDHETRMQLMEDRQLRAEHRINK